MTRSTDRTSMPAPAPTSAAAARRRVTRDTMVDVLRRRAVETPSRLAYAFLDEAGDVSEQLTFAALDERARTIGAWLRTRVAPGARVLLLYPPGLEYIAAFFGCLYAGVIAVPAYPPRRRRERRGQARLDTVIKDADVALALTNADALPTVATFVETGPVSALRCCSTTELTADIADGWHPVTASSDAVAFLQYTSGSTSDAKGVMVTHANIVANERMIQEACAHTAESTFVGWLPVYHDMGLLGNVLQPLYCGASSILMSPAAFLQRPSRWLRAISAYDGRTSGAPDFAYALCVRRVTDAECEGLDLSRWTIAFNGAERVRAETMREFAARFAAHGFRREAFFPCYGLAEATLIVSGGPRATPARVAEAQVSCGPAVRDTTIAIVDPDTRRRRPDGAAGEIWVSGPAVARGYWNRPQLSEAQLGARLPGGRRRFLRTGDLGFVDNGELFITGRLRDLIIIRGRNHHPEDLEWTVLRCDPQRRVECAAAFSVDRANEERLVIAVEAERRETPSIEILARAVRHAIAEQHELQVDDVVLVRSGTLPKTSSGKIQRYLCRRAYLEGTLAIIGHDRLGDADEPHAPAPGESDPRLTRDALAAADARERRALVGRYLTEMIGRRVGTATLAEDAPLVSAGLDSLIAVEAAHRVQTDLDVPLAMATLLSGATIAELADWICARLAPGDSLLVEPRAHRASAAYPLSHGQQALWFMHRADPMSAAYHISRALDVHLPLDVAALARAVAALAARHPQLRTRIVHDGVEWLQQADAAAAPLCVVADASGWSDAELDARLDAAAGEPFDLERGPVMRVTVYRRSPDRSTILLTLHHIVADLWSFGIILQQLGALYEQASRTDIAPAAADYEDFVAWQSRLLADAEGDRLWTFWQAELAGASTRIDIACERATPTDARVSRTTRQRFRLDADLSTRLRQIGQARGATLYVVLLAAFELLLRRYIGRDDFLVGTPVAGRGRAAFADVVGNFVNVLPMRARIDPSVTFTELIDQVRDTTVRALAHQEMPFSSLVERLRPARDPRRAPLCQVLFALQRTVRDRDGTIATLALEHDAPAALAGLPLQVRELRAGALPFELMLTMAELTDGTVAATLDAETWSLDERMAGRMARELGTLLARVAEHPETRLSEYPTLTPEEQARMLGAWNATSVSHRDLLPIALFERQARATPDAIAVSTDAEHLTYRGLDRAAVRLAARLRARGVGPDALVAIAMGRSPRLIVAMLGVMKAGAAFLPIDLEYPAPRIAFMLRDARVRLVLTDDGTLPEAMIRQPLADADALELLRVDAVGHAVDDAVDDAEIAAGVTAHGSHLAYVIYTSGSTGTPKGVQVPNAALANFLRDMPERVGIHHDSVVIATTPISFDVAALELLAPLTVGARICVAGRGDATDSTRLADLLARWQITVMQATPTIWQVALDDSARPIDRPPASPRLQPLTMLCGGEALGAELAARILGRAAVAHNLYGPTETTIWSSTHRLVSHAPPHAIGRPIANTQLYIVDHDHNLAPIGVIGELCIGGDGLARGYLGRPDLTADRFVPDPFGAPGGRLYRTGDRAWFADDGIVHFVGRHDRQIKLRGVRIELGDVEAALRAQPGVADAVVVLRAAPGEDPTLAAYITSDRTSGDPPSADGVSIEERLYAGLGAMIPASMLPSSITIVERFPTTPNGKLDRAALPAPRRAANAASRAPRTPLEAVIAAEWARVLDCGTLGIDDNFFACGGHSLLATRLGWQLQDTFPTRTPLLALLLRHPTVAELAAAIAADIRPGVDLDGRVRAAQRVQAMSDEEIEAALGEASACEAEEASGIMEPS